MATKKPEYESYAKSKIKQGFNDVMSSSQPKVTHNYKVYQRDSDGVRYSDTPTLSNKRSNKDYQVKSTEGKTKYYAFDGKNVPANSKGSSGKYGEQKGSSSSSGRKATKTNRSDSNAASNRKGIERKDKDEENKSRYVKRQ